MPAAKARSGSGRSGAGVTRKPVPRKPAARKPAAGRLAWTPAKIADLVARLKKAHPEARCSLDYQDPLQLLVATILSAQCTDERVNKVTPALFARYPGAPQLAAAPRADIEKAIQSTGFFRSKAQSIQECCRDLVEKHGGSVPRTMEDLTALRGVGRKTANVVLGNAYGIPGVVVDTHVGRLSRRLGLTREEDPVKVEHDLMESIPKSEWTLFSHLLIHHGRGVCPARKPHCSRCTLSGLCPRTGVEASD